MATISKTTKAKEAFIGYLHAQGMRITPERLSILEVISKHTGLFSIDMLHNQMSREAFPVATATLYNTMDLLIDAGIVRCIRLPHSHTALYRMEASQTPHVYLVCEQCGSIKETSGKTMNRILEQYRRGGFSTRTFQLSIYGLCKKCSKLTN